MCVCIYANWLVVINKSGARVIGDCFHKREQAWEYIYIYMETYVYMYVRVHRNALSQLYENSYEL